MALTSEFTSFSLDNEGRFLCNTLQEALDSAGQTVGGRKRDFDVIVVGGGTFGCVVAEHLFIQDISRSRRILVLEAGPFVLPEHVQNMPFMGGAPDLRAPWLNHPAVRYPDPGEPALNATILRDWLGLPATDTTPFDKLKELFKLEAPLAVQSTTLPGFFPTNKFSAVPGAIRAARLAGSEADGIGTAADARKRMTIVPDCHVQEL